MKERKKRVVTNRIFEEAGMSPDIQKHFNLIKPKLNVLAGTDQNFTWEVNTCPKTTEGIDPEIITKHERRKLSSIHGNCSKSQN